MRSEGTSARWFDWDFTHDLVAPDAVLDVVSPEICRRHRVAPLAIDGETLRLGMADPFDGGAIALVEILTGCTVVAVPVDWATTEPLIGAPPRTTPATTPRHLHAVPDAPAPTADAPTPTPPAPTTAVPEPSFPRMGDILVERGIISANELRHALTMQRRTGDRLGTLLSTLTLATPADIADALSLQFALPRYLASQLTPTSAVAGLVPEPTCRRHSMVPLDIKNHRLTVAVSDPGDPAVIEALRRHTRLPVDLVVAAEPDIIEALRAAHRDVQKDLSVNGLLNRRPDESAHIVLNAWQKQLFGYGALALLVLLFIEPILTLTWIGALAMVFYTAFSFYKIRAVVASLNHQPMLTISTEEAAAIPDADLPIYTVLVPLYMETSVLPRLVDGLAGLDYPVSKLDVKLLLEEDDVETVAAARAMNLPSFIDIVVTPDCHPKTKPKSCNYGLLYARGEFTVIFDAEDVPEKDQLRKAVAAFRRAPANVVCLQGRLNYYNRDQNMLTMWFTGEYSGWFDLFVPGLDNLNLPIPLGGTSNHFVTDALVELGAWDPFNVTEDADLGIRLFAAGYKTATLNSTTYEEANSETFNWIRQRSRWVKGYIQTWLVHMRNPGKLISEVGLKNFLGFQVVIAGTFAVFLLNPLQWITLILWSLTSAHVVRELFPGALFYIAWASFLIGNFTFVYINALAVVRRSYWNLMLSAILSPLYWMLMSIAAWRGLIQLITAPSYWEKTEHGLDDGAHADAVGEATP